MATGDTGFSPKMITACSYKFDIPFLVSFISLFFFLWGLWLANRFGRGKCRYGRQAEECCIRVLIALFKRVRLRMVLDFALDISLPIE